MADITVAGLADPRLALSQAGDLLARDPAGHNAVGTKLADAIRYAEPGRYWIGRADAGPAGIAVQQPAGASLAVAPMPADVVAAVARAVAADGVELPGVAGPAATASRFAAEWISRRPAAATPTVGERLYEVRDLRAPATVSGRPRRAAGADRELLLSWLPGFEAGPGWAGADPAAQFVTRRLAAGDVWIWDDDGPVSMAARTEAVAGVARIQAVNTPPDLRGRGYASAAVAALSARVLAAGLRCVLIAGLHNVAANAVYRRLGYEGIGEVLRYRFS